ncbi:MAG: selenoprotein B glycine/betaine/sarcosine/D-proline reductase, partial [Desulfofustis sp.]|nr:selenoprotein B glycine/betaine/sarcosine/D-proline reductase [Desulfofustis sp.]
MVRLEIYQEDERRHLLDLPCPTYDQTPFVTSVTCTHARVAVISTAGLHLRSDRPFGIGESEYRVIPKQVDPKDLVMSHVSTNFDHSGFQQDWNILFPIDRLQELAAEDLIGSVAAFHYSFMGAQD